MSQDIVRRPPPHNLSNETCQYVGKLPDFLHESLLAGAAHLEEIKERHKVKSNDAFGQILCTARSYVAKKYGGEHSVWFKSNEIRHAIAYSNYSPQFCKNGADILKQIAFMTNELVKNQCFGLSDIETCAAVTGRLDGLLREVRKESVRQVELEQQRNPARSAEAHVSGMMCDLNELDKLNFRARELVALES